MMTCQPLVSYFKKTDTIYLSSQVLNQNIMVQYFWFQPVTEWTNYELLVSFFLRSPQLELLAIGYKYNKRKVISFIATKGSGNTEPGTPYKSKWRDDNGDNVLKLIEQPDIISRYFLHSNVVDVGNQSR